jgi:hypothetical protein
MMRVNVMVELGSPFVVNVFTQVGEKPPSVRVTVRVTDISDEVTGKVIWLIGAT